ncbi:flagellar protein FliT [Marinobacterium sp. AK62]|uniref:Flagellar protein FliT n=1 Tax=Marinobacterium alkalitolerans TaxID=1542925 RepID=A0ABS3ZA10_9GAMM|nr:flagellar protein FliT [Marinobacterium alkalitolerans]MBP0048547.1 flagellar protein FliT [Marinobacterium alkalitolerans]
MDTITALALELLQATKTLVERCEQEDWDAIAPIQAQREQLVAALDKESQQPYPRDVLVGCRSLLTEAQALEQRATQILTQQKEEAGEAFQKLKAADKARKAYDRFR